MTFSTVSSLGCEYIVDAFDCIPSRLASRSHLDTLVTRLIAELNLHPVSEPLWHVFGGPGGITGLVLLAESHLAVHTFPERRYAAFNLFHCRTAPPWPWDLRLADALGAERVVLRAVMRGEASICHDACAS